jgi:3-dehydroquinate synthase
MTLETQIQERSSVFFEESAFGFQRLAGKRQVLWITDQHIYDTNNLFFEGREVMVLPAGEATKNFQQLEEILLRLQTIGADKQTVLAVAGGGMVSDIAGLAAALYMRGIETVYLPTSVLAMVDAALGGKTAINFGGIKNLLGVIRQPSAVIIDTGWLKTLPDSEWRNGLAEVIKHGCIREPGILQVLHHHNLETMQTDTAWLQQLIRSAVTVKWEVVAQDPHEKGMRKILNFGHTVGHAVEAETGIPHGQAVAVGMVYALHLSALEYGLDAAFIDSVLSLLHRYRLPVKTDVPFETLWKAILFDKKKQDGQLAYILLEVPGKAIIRYFELDELRTKLEAIHNQMCGAV